MRLLALAASLGVLLGGAQPTVPSLPGQAVALTLADGKTVSCTYAPAAAGKKTFLLVHGSGESSLDWLPLATALAQAGQGVFAPQLPVTAFGTAALHEAYPGVEAAASWLAASGVPEESLGLVGSEFGTIVAAKFAAARQKAPVLILLSPLLVYRDMPIINDVRHLAPTTRVLTVYAENDKRLSREAPLIHRIAQINLGAQNATMMTAADKRGTRMLAADPTLAGRIRDWAASPPSRP